jgi:PAS domain S-box-containing protein
VLAGATGQNNGMFELFFERSADAIWLFDPHAGVFVDCNQAAVELMRAGTKEKLLQMRPEQLAPAVQPDGRSSAEKSKEVVELAERYGGYRFEWTAQRFDGEFVPLEVLLTPINADGQTLNVVVSRDITHRKRTEAGLRESEQMFRSLFESSSDGILILDPEKQMFIDCNQAAVKMSRGGSRQWLLSQPLTNLAPERQPDGRLTIDRIRDSMAKALTQGSQHFEWTGLDFNREEFPVEITLTPLRVGERTFLMTVLRDVTERKKADAALRASQQLLASVADNITEAVYRTGPRHELIFANPAYLRLSGFESLEEMQQIPREQLYANASDRRRLLEALEHEGAFRDLEIEYVRRDGHRWWGLSNGVAIRDPQTGTVLYHVGSVADITERKRAEEKILQLNASLERRIAERTAELTTSEARLRTMVEHAPEAIVVFDGDTGEFLFGNEHACSIYGCAADLLTTLTPAGVSPEFQPDGRRSCDAVREWVQQTLRGETPIFEWIHKQPNGKLIPTEVRLVRLPAEGKNLLRASIIDNTERHRREKIQEATYRISEAVHTTDDLASFFHQIHTIVKGLMPAANLYIALLDATGENITFPYLVDENDLTGTPIPADKGLTGHVLRSGKALLAGPHNAVSPGGGIDIVLDGEEKVEAIPCGCSALVWLGAPLTIRGTAFGAIVVQDYHNPNAYGEEEKQILTFVAGQVALAIERKRGEQALRESEENFRALFAASSQGVMLHDEHRYLEINPAALRILGYDRPADVIGRALKDTSPPWQPNGERSDLLSAKHIEECLLNGSARFEWMAWTATKREIPVEVILTRIEWCGRQIIQAVINDITERKKAENELLKALAREKELGQLKSNFVAMVSHEFRTPLGVILSSAEILDMYLDQLAPEERREQLQSIQKNTKRMARLMEEVLLLGMVEAGKMDYKPASADLPAFCRHLIDELHSATDRKCPVLFHAPSIPMDAFADKRLLRHIFSNLLSNAVKYSPAGSPVEFEIERRGNEAICRIRDHGVGIPEQDLSWLFNAFHRGRNVAHLPGTGLGLTIVKRCVELHHGKIRVESSVGKGTTVTVILPVFTESPQPVEATLL